MIIGVNAAAKRCRRPNMPHDPLSPPGLDALYAHLAQRLHHMLSRQDPRLPPGERGRLFAWYWGHWGRAVLDLLLASGQDRFAQLMRQTIHGLVSQRDDRLGLVDEHRGRALPGWGVRIAGRRVNEITVAGLVLLPIAEYALCTGETALAELVFEGLDPFIAAAQVESRGGLDLVSLPDTQGGIEVLNHASVFGAALAHASRLPGAPPAWATLAAGLMAFHRAQMWSPGHWLSRPGQWARRMILGSAPPRCWPYAAPAPTAARPRAELLWKAAVTIELPLALVETGRADSSTVADISTCLRQSRLLRSGHVPRSIDPEEQQAMSPGSVAPGLAGGLAAWFQANDLALSRQIVSAMRQQPALFPGGWLGPSRSMVMGLAHLMRHGLLEAVLAR